MYIRVLHSIIEGGFNYHSECNPLKVYKISLPSLGALIYKVSTPRGWLLPSPPVEFTIFSTASVASIYIHFLTFCSGSEKVRLSHSCHNETGSGPLFCLLRVAKKDRRLR